MKRSKLFKITKLLLTHLIDMNVKKEQELVSVPLKTKQKLKKGNEKKKHKKDKVFVNHLIDNKNI